MKGYKGKTVQGMVRGREKDMNSRKKEGKKEEKKEGRKEGGKERKEGSNKFI